MRLFQKGVFWVPQALFTAEQAAAGSFFLKNDLPFVAQRLVFVNIWYFLLIFVNICSMCDNMCQILLEQHVCFGTLGEHKLLRMLG